MPEYYVFHQNLRVFAGGTSDRNDLFEDAMGEICSALGQDRVLVAGFTEVMNSANTRTPLRQIAQELDPSLRAPLLFAVGTTAVGNQTEWVGISTHTAFTVQISGKVLKLTNNTWQAYPSQTLAPDQMPVGNFAADVRGLAYIGGTWNNRTLLFGFMHNNYTLGEPSTIYRALPTMVTAIATAHGANWGQCTRYLGGDFNLYPSDIDANNKAIYATNDETMEAVKTTWYHPYDFWITNDASRTDADAEVYTQSRWENDNRLSDHAGVGLKIT